MTNLTSGLSSFMLWVLIKTLVSFLVHLVAIEVVSSSVSLS